jgi:sRNA-binding carbon storage regulator CsrA
VVAIRGNKIRLGFVAPSEVDVQREELLHDPDRSAMREASTVQSVG